MKKFRNIEEKREDTPVKNVYCIIKNKEDGFYWVLNLENHPGSFLLDKSFQNSMPSGFKENQESMVVFQPVQY